MPAIPNSFITRVEVASIKGDKHNLKVGKEMYDGNTRAGVLEYRLSESSGRAWIYNLLFSLKLYISGIEHFCFFLTK